MLYSIALASTFLFPIESGIDRNMEGVLSSSFFFLISRHRQATKLVGASSLLEFLLPASLVAVWRVTPEYSLFLHYSKRRLWKAISTLISQSNQVMSCFVSHVDIPIKLDESFLCLYFSCLWPSKVVVLYFSMKLALFFKAHGAIVKRNHWEALVQGSIPGFCIICENKIHPLCLIYSVGGGSSCMRWGSKHDLRPEP